MVRIVLPIENKVRELTGKLWLAMALARDGHQVALGLASPINLSLDVLKPDLYFALSAKDSERRRNKLRSLKRCGTTIAVLDTEGSVFPQPKEFRVRIDPGIMSLVDYYFAWGKAAVEVIEEYGNHPAGETVVTGNPRFDLIQKDLMAVYEPDARAIGSEIGEYILFNTNFAINHVDRESLVSWSTGHKRGVAQVQARVMGEMISAIGEVATALNPRPVIIRPHPSEDLDLYHRLFASYENVETRRDGDVRPWLMGSDAVVHNSCTTGVSAALLEKPVFAYTPDDLAFHPSPVPNAVSTAVKSKAELVQRLSGGVVTC